MTFATRTESPGRVRKSELAVLAAILLAATGLRLWHLDFGLPSLNDPDEPIFVMTALDMLREGRMNPGWFGHPATLLFYLLAIVIVAVGASFGGGTDAFVAAVYADPGILILPMRAAMAGLGVASVAMTWAIGRRAGGVRIGLIAAVLLACNPLHVEFSQVIRTDMLATLLMGWSMFHALSIARGGGTRDHVWAGVAAGLACATKWPAMLVLIAPAAAGCRAARGDRRAWRRVPVAPAVAVATLLVASPYLLLDWPTVLRDLGGEARPVHLGATGHGLAGNLFWYLRYPLFQSFGAVGLVLIVLGAIGLRRDRAVVIVLLPVTALMLVALAAQSLVWARWLVPLLPVAAVLAAIGVDGIWRRARLIGAIALIGTSSWMAGAALHRASAHADDPRQAATAWTITHVPRGRSILVEHAAFDLLSAGHALRFPLGSDGCVDVRALLAGAPSHRSVNDRRTGRAIVDLGNVEPSRLPSCRADLLLLSNHRRYHREPATFAPQLRNYRALLKDYRRIAAFPAPPSLLPNDDRTVELYALRLGQSARQASPRRR